MEKVRKGPRPGGGLFRRGDIVVQSAAMSHWRHRPARLQGVLTAVLVTAGFLAAPGAPPAQAAEPSALTDLLEIPQDLNPEGRNEPVLSEGEPGTRPDHYDADGFPEDARGLLYIEPAGAEFFVRLRSLADPFLLYAQFANRQRDAVFLARDGAIRDPLPDGTFHEIPYGCGALKTNTAYISLVEGLLLPHVSDNQKGYEQFPLQDLYLGASLGVTGLLAELRYVYRERMVGYAQAGVNLLGGVGGPFFAPFNYYALTLRLGGGVQFPGLLQTLIGNNHWSVGADLLLGFGDADRNPATPSVVWVPGVFFELEKRDLFGWGDRWVGLGDRGDFREDPRPQNYHVRALYARIGFYLDFQSLGLPAAVTDGFARFDLAVGFRYNVVGPRIPEHRFKETRVVYVSDEYRDQLSEQLRRRELRLERLRSEPLQP
jgi:hypothetical protein